MSGPFQVLNHSDPGRLANGQTNGRHEAKPPEVRHLSAHTSRKNSPVACFDPPHEVVSTRNPVIYNKRAADPVHSDLGRLLVKNKNLLTELRNLQKKLSIKETSLQEMKTELESYKENNMQQLFQIMSLKDDIKDLQELTASLTRIKSLKNTNIQSLKRGNWDLTERIMELENQIRAHLLEREKAEQRDFLEKKFSGANRFTPYMYMKGQEESLDIFMMKDKDEAILSKNFERNILHSEGPKDEQKKWDKCEQDLVHKEQQTSELDRPPYSFGWETKTAQSQYLRFLGQLAALPGDGTVPIPATEEAVNEKIQETGANEQPWKSKTKDLQMFTKRLEQLHYLYKDTAQKSSQTEEKYWEQKRPLKHLEGKIEINDFFQGRLDLDKKKENSKTTNSQTDEHSEKFKQLEENNTQQMILNIQQNLQIATTQRLEEKIQKLQKQLSDLKLSNKSMKTQLTRVNVLKDKTIEKLRKSLTKVETTKEKAVMQTENLKATLDSGEQEVGSDKERAHQMLDAVTPELSTAKGTLEEVPGQEQKLADFRETIMKMLGFNMKTADKEIINQLRLIIQVYEISKKSKTASDCETRQDNK
ncbi:coiled-coil domain-containing protein 170-like isoform X2 [Microcebus murinus]|uniref:coiled-coil domain-containing protein 170-like isoform X2 n=1 Tax=Microcebus murinus TaxID=30608 RepID=UPI003F6C00C6